MCRPSLFFEFEVGELFEENDYSMALFSPTPPSTFAVDLI